MEEQTASQLLASHTDVNCRCDLNSECTRVSFAGHHHSAVLERFLLSRRILDMGSGISGVCGLAAVGRCRAYVFVYPDAAYKQGLRESLHLNSCRVVCERLRLVSVAQLFSELCASDRKLFDCLVLRMADCSCDYRILAESVLEPGGLLLLLVQGCHGWPTKLDGLDIIVEHNGVVCAKLA